MFPYSHPATEYVCRHCRKPAGHDPEMCIFCGPICWSCLNAPGKCAGELAHEKEMAKKKAEQEQNNE